MAKNNNISDLLKSVADAIRAKKGTTGLINPQNFDAEIASIPSGGGVVNLYGFTGHVDEAGLRRLNWNDRDIELLQKVCWWNEEEDDSWKVSEANITKGLTMTWSNFKNFANDADIVFFPKLSSPAVSYNFFGTWDYLMAIPTDGWRPTGRDMRSLWVNCPSLIYVGALENFIGSNIALLASPFPDTLAWEIIAFDTWDVSGVESMQFISPLSLRRMPDISSWDLSKVTSFTRFMQAGRFIVFDGIPALPRNLADTVTRSSFDNTALTIIRKAGKQSCQLSLSQSPLTRESCLVLFNALDADNPNTITLSAVSKRSLTADDIAIATSKGWTVA